MRPRIPTSLLDTLRNSNRPPPWKCKLHLRRGRIVYAVEINANGEMTRVGGRDIYSASDIGFTEASIERVEF